MKSEGEDVEKYEVEVVKDTGRPRVSWIYVYDVFRKF